MNFDDYKGMYVTYRSRSGREYKAIITRIPENPTNSSIYPTVTLMFNDIRGKYVIKERVLPFDAATDKRKVWIYTEGKYAWKNGRFVEEDMTEFYEYKFDNNQIVQLHVDSIDNVTVTELLRSDQLKPGTFVVLEDGSHMWIGNGTPFEEPSEDSHKGWNWDKWNKIVKEVHTFVRIIS